MAIFNSYVTNYQRVWYLPFFIPTAPHPAVVFPSSASPAGRAAAKSSAESDWSPSVHRSWASFPVKAPPTTKRARTMKYHGHHV